MDREQKRNFSTFQNSNQIFIQKGKTMKDFRNLTTLAADLVKLFSECEIDKRKLNALMVLDEDFARDTREIYDVLSYVYGDGASTTTETLVTTPVITDTPEVTETTAAETPEATVMTSDTTTIPDGFYKHPKFDVYGNKEGVLLTSDNMYVNKHVAGGLLMVHVGGKTRMAGRIIYECCTGTLIPQNLFIRYRDNNKKNVSFENLFLSKEYGKHHNDASTIRQVCEIIRDNPQAETRHQLSKLVLEKSIPVGEKLILSILSGKYKEISDKYFVFDNGKRIAVVQESSLPTTKAAVTIEKKEEVVEETLEEKIKKFDRKYLQDYPLTSEDRKIPILKYMYNDTGTVNPVSVIQDLIRIEYGNEMVPSSKRINEVINELQLHKL